jgi:hypothetical protein
MGAAEVTVAVSSAPSARPMCGRWSTWRRWPRTFLIAEEDRMIPAQTQRFMAERMGATVRRHMVDHIPLVTAPSHVTDLLVDVVEDARRNLPG